MNAFAELYFSPLIAAWLAICLVSAFIVIMGRWFDDPDIVDPPAFFFLFLWGFAQYLCWDMTLALYHSLNQAFIAHGPSPVAQISAVSGVWMINMGLNWVVYRSALKMRLFYEKPTISAVFLSSNERIKAPFKATTITGE